MTPSSSPLALNRVTVTPPSLPSIAGPRATVILYDFATIGETDGMIAVLPPADINAPPKRAAISPKTDPDSALCSDSIPLEIRLCRPLSIAAIASNEVWLPWVYTIEDTSVALESLLAEFSLVNVCSPPSLPATVTEQASCVACSALLVGAQKR